MFPGDPGEPVGVRSRELERLPVEQAIGDTVRAFKDVPLQGA